MSSHNLRPRFRSLDTTSAVLHDLETAFEEHRAVLALTREAVSEDFERLVDLCVEALRAGRKLMLFGNGGSAADAQHIATEMTVRFTVDRAPLAALSLVTDTSAMTAIANDLGHDQVFARQLAAIGNPGDVALAITTSGRSRNVLAAIEVAQKTGIRCAALTGKGGGELVGLVSPLLIVPSSSTARVQEMHGLLGHALCGAVEETLGLVG
jgi:D-sedoheptulose 7-phosphate isomerase